MSNQQQGFLPTVPVSSDESDSPLALSWRDAMTWEEFDLLAARTVLPFKDKFDLRFFNYIHPIRLQEHWPEHQRKDTPIRICYTDWGDMDAPPVICVGGIANTARRWDYLADTLSRDFRVFCLDWPGRGMSTWMPTQGDYSQDTNVEMIRQFLDHIEAERVHFIGSSLGGSVAMALAARYPERLDRLILNDIGPYMPAERRTRRAQAVARHYVFRRPKDLFCRLGAAAKNDGPVPEQEMLHNTYFQTKWSDSHGGRVYRHDPRALQAYAEAATQSIEQWPDWEQVKAPVLVIHGMLSDALLDETVAQMAAKAGVTVMEVPKTGHTPALSDANQIHFVQQWLRNQGPEGNFTCLLPGSQPRHLFGAPPQSPPLPAPAA